MTVTHERTDQFGAVLQEIARLGPATEAGFEAAVRFGKELVSKKSGINFAIGDVAVLVAPSPTLSARTKDSLADRDSKRLAEWTEKVGLDHSRVLGLRRTSVAFPPVRRNPVVSHRVYQELAAVEAIEGLHPVMWIEKFLESNDGRAPSYTDVIEARGQYADRVVTAAKRTGTKTQVRITETLIATSPEAAAAAAAALEVRAAREADERQRLLDGEGSSTALSVAHEVLEIEQALVRIIPILARATDNVALIAGATQADHIATLSLQVGRMAMHLGEVVALDPAQILA